MVEAKAGEVAPAFAACDLRSSPPLPEPGSAHILHSEWHEDLDRESIATLAAVLNNDERTRFARFRQEVHRLSATLSWSIVRRLLGNYLGISPTSLEFEYGPHGKPYLAANFNEPGLMFNLSHTDHHILLGVSRRQETGVDVERIRPRRLLDAIAERHYHAREVTELKRLLPEPSLQAFYRYWTLKEAWIKALGAGLSYPIQNLDFSEIVASGSRGEFVAEARTWWVEKLSLADGLEAAVALDITP